MFFIVIIENHYISTIISNYIHYIEKKIEEVEWNHMDFMSVYLYMFTWILLWYISWGIFSEIEWLHLSGSSYRLFPDVLLLKSEAQALCAEHNAHLVRLETQEEFDRIVGIINSTYGKCFYNYRLQWVVGVSSEFNNNM